MKTAHAVFLTTIATWLVLSVFGNVCFIVVIFRNKGLRNLTNWLICNIAVSDILLAAFAIPQLLHDISHTKDYFEPEFLCRTVNALPIFCITSSIYSMAALSIERYQSIVKNRPITRIKHVTWYLIAAIWLLSLGMSLPTVVEFGIGQITVIDAGSGNVSLVLTCHQVMPRVFSISNGFMVLFVSYVIPQAVVYTNYMRLGYFIWQKSRADRARGGQEFSVVIGSKVKVIKMLVWAATLFTFAWIPYFTLQTIQLVTGTKSNASVAEPMFLTQLVLSTFSTSYNVILYVTYVKHYRKAFRNLLCRCWVMNDVSPIANDS